MHLKKPKQLIIQEGGSTFEVNKVGGIYLLRKKWSSSLYQYLNRAKDEDSVEALDVGVGKEGCWDGEHLQRGEEVARHRGGPRDVHVHLIAQVAYKIQDIGNVGCVAEQHERCREEGTVDVRIIASTRAFSVWMVGSRQRWLTSHNKHGCQHRVEKNRLDQSHFFRIHFKQ